MELAFLERASNYDTYGAELITIKVCMTVKGIFFLGLRDRFKINKPFFYDVAVVL